MAGRYAETLLRAARALEAVSEWTGRGVAWLVLAMTLVVGYDVGMRYLFQQGSVALQELEWHLFALVFLLGAAYTLKHDGHVRVEVIYQHLTPRQQAWCDLFGDLFFLLPFCALVVAASWPFVANSFAYGEHSPDPGGLPFRWLLKAAIPAGFGLLALQGLADALRKTVLLFAGGGR